MNVVDIVVAAVVLLSALLAFLRGFFAEVMSIVGWVGAAAVALIAWPFALPYVQQYIRSQILADILTVGGVFVIALIVLTLIGQLVTGLLDRSPFAVVNRPLGLVFGVARGAVLICFAYLVVDKMIVPDVRPAWLLEARSLPYAAAGAQLILDLVPEEIRRQAFGDPEAPPDHGAVGGPAAQVGNDEALRRQQTLVPDNGSAASAAAGYGARERDSLERLIENTAGGLIDNPGAVDRTAEPAPTAR